MELPFAIVGWPGRVWHRFLMVRCRAQGGSRLSPTGGFPPFANLGFRKDPSGAIASSTAGPSESPAGDRDHSDCLPARVGPGRRRSGREPTAARKKHRRLVEPDLPSKRLRSFTVRLSCARLRRQRARLGSKPYHWKSGVPRRQASRRTRSDRRFRFPKTGWLTLRRTSGRARVDMPSEPGLA